MSSESKNKKNLHDLAQNVFNAELNLKKSQINYDEEYHAINSNAWPLSVWGLMVITIPFAMMPPFIFIPILGWIVYGWLFINQNSSVNSARYLMGKYE